MTAEDFASLAGRIGPNVVVRPLLDTVQFRVGDKAFATLCWPRVGWAVVKVDPRRQSAALTLSKALSAEPGRRRKDGILLARLDGLDLAQAADLLAMAWTHACGQRDRPTSRTAMPDRPARAA